MGDSTRSDVRSKRAGAVGPAMAFAAVPVLFWWLNPANNRGFRGKKGRLNGKQWVFTWSGGRKQVHTWYSGIVGWMIREICVYKSKGSRWM